MGRLKTTSSFHIFFWEHGSKLQNSVLGCLRTLLWQLLHFTTRVSGETSTVDTANLDSIRRLQSDIIKTICNIDRRVIALLDGLDECRETNEVLDLVESLAALPHVKLCISSRPEEAYLVQFSDFAKLRLQDLNRDDIVCFVENELLGNPRVRRSPSSNADAARKLANSVINNAEGVFLWARLVVKDLLRGWTNRDDMERMWKRLQRLPHDVYDLYTQLMRRDQDNMVEYAEDAAFYCQILANRSSRTVTLAILFFAVNDELRARYLDTKTVFGLSLEELERDVDLETLITWINVRTAGLLEVKAESARNLFYYCHGRPRKSCGKFAQFQGYWVGFVHRPAYTYLTDTSEGQELLNKCPVVPDTVINIFVESQLTALLIVPGMHSLQFHREYDLHDVLPVQAITNSSVRRWCRLLQIVCDILFTRRLMTAAKDWKLYPHMNHFPTSKFRKVDLCMYLADTGNIEIVEKYAQEYECQNDHQYVADVVIRLVSRHARESEKDPGSVYMLSLLRRLEYHLHAFCSTGIQQSDEERSILIQLAKIAASTTNEKAAPIWEFLETKEAEDCPVTLPSSRELVTSYVFNAESDQLFVAAALLIDTTRAWAQREDLGKYSANGRALFFKDGRAGENYRVINPTNSVEVLECLRLMTLLYGQYLSGPEPKIAWCLPRGAGFRLWGNRASILSKGLQRILTKVSSVARSLTAYSAWANLGRCSTL